MKKRALKNQPSNWFLVFCMCILAFGISGMGVSNYCIRRQIDETNRLLAFFQHADIVKPDCAAGFVDIDGNCYATIGLARQLRKTDQCDEGLFSPPCDGRDEGEGLE
jgi:hypothetical protein